MTCHTHRTLFPVPILDQHRAVVDPRAVLELYWNLRWGASAIDDMLARERDNPFRLLSEFQRITGTPPLASEDDLFGFMAVEMDSPHLDTALFDRIDWSDPESVEWYDAVRVIRWKRDEPTWDASSDPWAPRRVVLPKRILVDLRLGVSEYARRIRRLLPRPTLRRWNP